MKANLENYSLRVECFVDDNKCQLLFKFGNFQVEAISNFHKMFVLKRRPLQNSSFKLFQKHETYNFERLSEIKKQRFASPADNKCQL